MPEGRSAEDDNRTSMYCYLKTGEFSDLTITCGDVTWTAHRVVVCSKSSFFKAAVASNFKEAATGVINLEGDNPWAVQLMIDFMYTSDYGIDCTKLPNVESSILVIHTEVFCLGDKYDINALRNLACAKYAENLYHKNDYDDYFRSISGVYRPQASQNLRKVVIYYARPRLWEFFEKSDFKAGLKAAINNVPEFGFDLLEASVTSKK